MRTFDSRKNYLKIGFQDAVPLERPRTLDSTYGAYVTEYTVTHNLGYRPLVRAWYDAASDGEIFNLNGQKFGGWSSIYPFQVDFKLYVDEITTTTVRFRADRDQPDGALSDNFILYYKIYLDRAV